MGSLDAFKNRFKSPKNVYKDKTLKTKGERLGWVSLNETETVELKKVLTNGEVVRLNQDYTPMLVP